MRAAQYLVLFLNQDKTRLFLFASVGSMLRELYYEAPVKENENESHLFSSLTDVASRLNEPALFVPVHRSWLRNVIAYGIFFDLALTLHRVNINK